jgi:hypothetical protein
MTIPPPPPAPQFSKTTVIEDVKSILKQAGMEFREVRKCTANIEELKAYVYYLRPYERPNAEAVIKSFIENECKPHRVNNLYLWTSRDQSYTYVNVGFFTDAEEGVKSLNILMVITLP